MSLTLDSRFGLDLDLAAAERIVPFIANAIAIAAGFASHTDPVSLPPMAPRKIARLDGLGSP